MVYFVVKLSSSFSQSFVVNRLPLAPFGPAVERETEE